MPGNMTMPEYMTIPEVAALIRSSERSVYEWLRVGKMGGVRAGSKWLVTREDVETFLNLGRVAAPGAAGASGAAPALPAAGPPSGAPGSGPVVAAGPTASGPKPTPLQNRKNKSRGR